MREQKHIIISVDGGLGDHITAEPAVRYLREHFLKNNDVHIAAHWPRVFAHLDIPVHVHNQFDRKGIEYETMWTLGNYSAPLWQAVCFLLCPMTDYHSMLLMQRILPLKDREIRLQVADEDRASLNTLAGNTDFSRVVAVHAGKSQKNKTFPREWWQSVVNGLSAAGYTVCLFGKSASDIAGDTTGFVPVDAPPGALDLRDKLSLGELFALIERAPILLSNDSSPVQIAGAFDNWNVMVATIKPPDMVFPYRNGSPHYKTKALYKRLLADDIFNTLDLRSATLNVDVDDWSRYLPEPETVVEEIRSLKAS